MKHKCPDCGLSLTEDCGFTTKGVWRCVPCFARYRDTLKPPAVDIEVKGRFSVEILSSLLMQYAEKQAENKRLHGLGMV